jgi:hypothetical protein
MAQNRPLEFEGKARRSIAVTHAGASATL